MLELILACVLGLLPGFALAAAAEDHGLAIAEEVDRRDSGWQDTSAALEMILRNKHGQESRRKLRIKSLEVTGDGDQSLTIFDSPRDVAGTALHASLGLPLHDAILLGSLLFCYRVLMAIIGGLWDLQIRPLPQRDTA